jgi:LAO/AO transport system kinase
MPGGGDSVQALKAGIMEIPDVIVVNKSDHPLTQTMVREIRGVLSLAPQGPWKVPIVQTEAVDGKGVDELMEKILEHRAHIEEQGTLSERRRRNLRNEVLAIATGRMRRKLEHRLEQDESFQKLVDEVVSRRLDPASAATTILEDETS